MVQLESLSEGTARAFGVSADGSVVVGWGVDNTWQGIFPARGLHALRWTQAGLERLGMLNGGLWAYATGVSADGLVTIGVAADGATANAERAFRWTRQAGMVSLGTLNGGNFSHARGANGDGSVIVGTAADGAAGNAERAFRWTPAGGMVSLGTLGGASSQARRTTPDGSVVVGRSAIDGLGNVNRAFRWTQPGGMVNLGTLPGHLQSEATGVSADGSVIVGTSIAVQPRGFRWTQSTGMQTIEDWLTASGAAISHGFQALSAGDVSADGSTVVGTLQNLHAYIARARSGMVSMKDLADSLSGVLPQTVAVDVAGMIMHGAHGNPLLGRVRPGQSCVWVAGDWGRDDHGARDGSLGLAEAGACTLLASGLQLGGSLGVTRSRQNLLFNGDMRHDGQFVTVEATKEIGRRFWATLTGLYHQGDADVRRGYLNAGLLDFSRGNADTRTWGARARFDWEDTLRAGGFGFSPYGEVSYIEARVGSFTESDGGFPARFDGLRERDTEARLGINTLKPLSSDLRFLGTLEAAHRFDREGTHSTGQVLGLFAFEVPGRQYERNWLRAESALTRNSAEEPPRSW